MKFKTGTVITIVLSISLLFLTGQVLANGTTDSWQIFRETAGGADLNKLKFYWYPAAAPGSQLENPTLTLTPATGTGGNVGIGTKDPAYKLHVKNTDIASSGWNYMVSNELIVAPPVDHTVGNRRTAAWNYTGVPSSNTKSLGRLYGAQNQVENWGTGPIEYLFGTFSYALNQGGTSTGPVTGVYGSWNSAVASGDGPVTNLIGSHNTSIGTGTAVVTNHYGIRSRVEKTGSSVVTNRYGLYLEAVGSLTNDWGVYVAYGAKNYFNGSVGIGTTEPIRPLHIMSSANNQQLRISDTGVDGTNQGRMELGYDSSSSYGRIQAWKSGVDALPIVLNPSGGNVGIGYTAPTTKLAVNGDLYVNGSATKSSSGTGWQVSSDIRLKDIQGNYNYGLKEILQLRPVFFSYKKDNPLNLPSDEVASGFVAQEVQKVIPEAVNTGKDGYLKLNADPIHWANVKAVQELYALFDTTRKEQQGQIDRQAQEIEALRQEIQELKQMIAR